MEAWGFSFTMDLKDCNNSTIKSRELIQEYVIKLCKLLNLERHGDCLFAPINPGSFAMAQFIKPAFITGIFIEADNSAHLDICAAMLYENFNAIQVIEFTKHYFDTCEITTHLNIRG